MRTIALLRGVNVGGNNIIAVVPDGTINQEIVGSLL
jgi:hypothetical protein